MSRVFAWIAIITAPSIAAAATDCPSPHAVKVECERMGGHVLDQTGGGTQFKCVVESTEVTDGPTLTLFSNGAVKSCGRFRNGRLSGEWLRFWPNGKLQDRVNWDNGIPSGSYEAWDEEGKIAEMRSYNYGDRTDSLPRPAMYLGLALTGLNYEAAGIPYRALSASPRIQIEDLHPFGWRVNFGAEAELRGAVNFYRSSVESKETQFLNASLRAGTFLMRMEQSRLLLQLGLHYGGIFGLWGAGNFGRLSAELYPAYSLNTAKGGTIRLYLKFVPYTLEGQDLLGQSNKAAGASYTFPLKAKSEGKLRLNLDVNIDDRIAGTSQIRERSISLGAAYGW